MSVLRIDRVQLLRRDAVEVTAEGFRLYDALFARTGIQLYSDGAGGVSREYRPPDEVFDAASLASYELRPLTDGHPENNLDTQTASAFARGAVSNARKHSDGIHVVGRLAVWDDGLIEKFDAGQVDLSAGYGLDVDQTPGIDPAGDHFDSIHRKIRINHVSGVIEGRAGTARLLTDPAQLADGWGFADPELLQHIASQRARPVYVDMGRWARSDSKDLRTQQTKDTTMKIKIQIDGKDVEVDVPDKATPQQLADAIRTLVAPDPIKAKAALDAAVKLAVDKASAERDRLLAPKLDAAEQLKALAAKEKADADAQIKALKEGQTANRDRADTLSVARVVLGLGYSAETTKAMQLDTIERVLGKPKRDSLEAHPQAIGFVFAEAAQRFEADRATDHGGNLVTEINLQRAKATDGKGAPEDTTAADRKRAADRAGMTRDERKRFDAQQKAS